MSEVKPETDKIKGLFEHDLQDDEYLACLKGKYITFLAANYGPKGKSTLIQTSGGNNVLTSSSSTFLQQLSFFHPTFKYINALINSQNRAYGVHGLYVGLLCSELLYRTLMLEKSVPFPIISEVALWIIEELMKKFEQFQDRITIDMDLANVGAVLNFVRSILSSKGHRMLSSDETKHVSLKIVEAFLKTFPTDPRCGFSHIHISTLEGPSSLQTRLFEGLLYREPNYSYMELQTILTRLPKGDLKVLLLNIPLSHEASPKTESIEWCGENQLNFVYNELFSTLFKKCLKEKDINVLANQKYIHPIVKHELEREGILVIERLGVSLAQSLMQISDCCPIVQLSNLDSDITEEVLGHLSHIDLVLIEEKLFLNLRSIRASQNSTLLLTGINVHVVEHLQEAVDSCICLLRLASQDPTMIVGGGCLEAFLCCIIAELKRESSSLASEFDTTLSEVSKVFDAFIGVFSWLSTLPKGGMEKRITDFTFDNSNCHLWEAKDDGLEETNGHRHSPSETFLLVPDRCACKSFFKRELDSNISFTPLSFLRDDFYLRRPPLFVNDDVTSKMMKMNIEAGSNDAQKSPTLPNSQSHPSHLSMGNDNGYNVSTSHSQSSFLSIGDNGSQSERFENSTQSCRKKVYPSDTGSGDSSGKVPPRKRDRIPWREDSILEYLPAKRNALRLAFEGFSELHQVGMCIFDK